MKVKIKLIGQDGNIFNLVGIASRAMKKSGQRDKSIEMSTRVFEAENYQEALKIISEYCEIE